MTRTREEDATDIAWEEARQALADAAISSDPALIPERRMEYEEWLAWTGKDDSFVGGEAVAGTEEIYEAAMRACERRFGGLDPAPT